MSHIEETNRALERHLAATKTRDAVTAVLCGVVAGAVAYLLIGTGGAAPSGGVSPTVGTTEGWPIVGTLAGVVGGLIVARFTFTGIRQRRRRRFWGL